MAKIRIPQTAARDVHAKMQDYFPHKVFVPPEGKNAEDVDKWCVEMVGVCARMPNDPVLFIETDGDWCYFAWHWYFKDPDHATCFRMVFG